MNSQRGFTLIELLLALGVGTLVLLLIARAFMTVVATHEEVMKDLVVQRNARSTVQWILQSVQAAAEVRAGTSTAVELAGVFEPTRGTECRGFFLARLQPSTVVVYERRRLACAEGATSAGGELVVVSDPTTSVSLLTFRYLDKSATSLNDAKGARVLEVSIEVDADRDGRSEARLTELASLRLR
jgi:prepilin-type N-terminal cleavage/methylation domain-containing protein